MNGFERRIRAPAFLFFAVCMLSALTCGQTAASESVLIGLDADMSASSAIGGEAIRRGAAIAIDEVNRAGGVLGRPLELVVRDHRGNPDRGVDNINDFAVMDDLVAVLGRDSHAGRHGRAGGYSST